MWAMMMYLLGAMGCGEVDEEVPATVTIVNDFDNPEAAAQPPWTLCQVRYLGQDFGTIGLGEQSEPMEVEPGLGYVLMIASFGDPSCPEETALPLASRGEEEVVPGQARTITIGLPSHAGPCPPEGVPPMDEAAYEQIRQAWPDQGFEPYERRTENAGCQDDDS